MSTINIKERLTGHGKGSSTILEIVYTSNFFIGLDDSYIPVSVEYLLTQIPKDLHDVVTESIADIIKDNSLSPNSVNINFNGHDYAVSFEGFNEYVIAECFITYSEEQDSLDNYDIEQLVSELETPPARRWESDISYNSDRETIKIVGERGIIVSRAGPGFEEIPYHAALETEKEVRWVATHACVMAIKSLTTEPITFISDGDTLLISAQDMRGNDTYQFTLSVLESDYE